MPYCVNCGVELNPQAERCPLCQTPAWHPETEPRAGGEPYFPREPAVVSPASRLALFLLLSSMLACAALCCGILNLFVFRARFWSLYVMGAMLLFWIWFALPMLLRRVPLFLKLTLDVAAVGVYVWMIAADLRGMHWFLGLALPVLCVVLVMVFLLSFLLRGGRRSRLSAIAMCIASVGITAMGIEFCLDRFFTGKFVPGWSLAILVICMGLVVPLRVVRRVPSLRNAARRRFDL